MATQTIDDIKRATVQHSGETSPWPVQKVLLINPFLVNNEEPYDLDIVLKNGQFVDPPIGLGYIKSFLLLNLKDIEVKILDANIFAVHEINQSHKVDMPRLWGQLRESIMDFSPDLVGVSCLFHSGAYVAHQTLALIKEISRDIITVLGGNYGSGTPDIALTDPNLDFILESEGEFRMLNLISAIRDGANLLETVDGIHFQMDDKEFLSPKTGSIDNVDVLPNLDRSDFPMSMYNEYRRNGVQKLVDRHKLIIGDSTASRGCPFRCTFCSSESFWGGAIRYRDPVKVVDEMEFMIKEYGTNFFLFNDDNFLFNPKKVIEFCDEIIRRKLDINWLPHGGMQVSAILKKNIVEKLTESGVIYWNLAVESGNAEILKRTKKPLILKQTPVCIERIRSANKDAYINGNFVLGFPYETWTEIYDTLDFAGSLDLDWRSIYPFQPLPSTVDYEYAIKKGYIERFSISHSGSWFTTTFDTENFTAKELESTIYSANLEYNFVKQRNLVGENYPLYRREMEHILNMVPDHAFSLIGLLKTEVPRSPEWELYLPKLIKLYRDSSFWQGYMNKFSWGLEYVR